MYNFKTISKLSVMSLISLHCISTNGMSVDLKTTVNNLDEHGVAIALILSKPSESDIAQALKALQIIEKKEEIARVGQKIGGAVKIGLGVLATGVAAHYAYKSWKDHQDYSPDQSDSYGELLSRLILGRSSKLANAHSAAHGISVPVIHAPLTFTAGAVGVAGIWSVKSGITNLIQKDRLEKVTRIRELLEAYSKKNGQ